MSKKAAFVIIVFLGAVLVARQATGKTSLPPNDMPVERIDRETGELMTKTHGEWEKIGQKGGKYMNPESGEYTMVVPIICAVCGEKIPDADIPAEFAGPFPDEESRQKAAADLAQYKSRYHCPKCAGLVHSEPKQAHQFPSQPPEQKKTALNKRIVVFTIPALALVGAAICVYAWAIKKRKDKTGTLPQE